MKKAIPIGQPFFINYWKVILFKMHIAGGGTI